MIAILEWTQSNVQQNIEQLQTPTMGVTINKSQQQQSHRLRTDNLERNVVRKWGNQVVVCLVKHIDMNQNTYGKIFLSISLALSKKNEIEKWPLRTSVQCIFHYQ